MAETFLDATAQAKLVSTGQVSPLELVDDAINRAEKLNDELNAIIHPLYEQARERAREPLPDGPFRGVPIVFKDLGAAVAGDLYHEGLKVLRDLQWRAPRTDALAQKFLDAGFVCIGRTNTPEFGLVPTTEPEAYGATRNPWDTTRTTGGSSGGSAATVASGIVPVAHANDGGGSIRIPASCCGLVGLKPSRGRVSFMPETTILEDMLVVQGCVSRSVRDTAAVLDAVQGSVIGDTVRAPEPARPYREEVGADPGKLRIAFLAHNPLGTGEIHPDCVAATRSAAALLESLGHAVEDAYPESIADEALLGHFMNLWAGNLAFAVRATEAKAGRPIRADDVEALTWSLAELGNQVAAVDYIAAEHAIIEMTRGVEEWFATAGYDLVLTPTLGEPPVPLGTFQTPDEPMLGFMRAATFVPYTPLNNMTGSPAISLPLAWNDDNLPVGVQLQSAYGREDLLLRVAAQLEAAQPWAHRVPPVHA